MVVGRRPAVEAGGAPRMRAHSRKTKGAFIKGVWIDKIAFRPVD